MKISFKLLFFLTIFFVGITNVDAASFKIGDVGYDTLVDAVAAVPADGKLTTIEMTEDVTSAPGVEITEGKNIIIDFKGHRYQASEPFVGSKGTETISFRFLKGSTVQMKNGYLVASNHKQSKMFIQNYADLTLDNITIDATNNNYDAFYALSSNHGKVFIINDTSILVNENTHARAFDMCWAPKVSNGIYADGTQIVVETEGKITGYIELDVWGTYTDEGGIKSTLEIKNIDFHGKWMADSRLINQLTIDGGRYFNPGFDEAHLPPAIPTTENPYIDIRLYLKDGNASYNLGEHFYVLPSKMVAYDNEKLFIIKGNEYNFTKNLPAGYEQFVKYDIADKTIVTVENGILKGLKDGVTKVTVTLGETKTGAITKEFDAIVFDLDAATDYQPNKNESGAVTNVMNQIVAEVIEEALDDNSNKSIDKTTRDNLIAAIEQGKTVTSKIDVKEVKEDELDKDVVKQIKDTVKDGSLVSFLNIDLLLEADNNVLGKVTSLGKSIEITVDVDKKLGNVPQNKKRTFFVVRSHEGEEPEIIKAEYKDGKLTFATDRFSSYAYGYTDEANPSTSDNLMVYVTCLTLSAASLMVIKRRRNA